MSCVPDNKEAAWVKGIAAPAARVESTKAAFPLKLFLFHQFLSKTMHLIKPRGSDQTTHF